MNKEYADKLHKVIPQLITEGHISFVGCPRDEAIFGILHVADRDDELINVLQNMLDNGQLTTTVVPVEECTDTVAEELVVLFHSRIDALDH